jgi:YD repeat-containing protein
LAGTPPAKGLYITNGPATGDLWYSETQSSSNYADNMSVYGVAGNQVVLHSGINFEGGITAGPPGSNAVFVYEFDQSLSGKPSYIDRVATDGSGLVTPYRINGLGPAGKDVLGPDGNLWFTEVQLGKIGRMALDGTGYTEFALPSPTCDPFGIAVGPDGALWFTEYNSNKIGRITTSGSITEYAIPTANSNPRGITAGPLWSNTLWFTEAHANQFAEITLGPTPTITEYGGLSANSQVEDITTGQDYNVWFTEPGVNKVGTLRTVSLGAQPVDFTAVEGAAFTGQTVAWVESPINGSASLPLSGTIDWGDGTPVTSVSTTNGGIVASPPSSNPSVWQVQGGHTYAEATTTSSPPYDTVTVTVTDSLGVTAQTTGKAFVQDAALTPNPAVRTLPDATVGTPTGTLTLAEFLDAAGSDSNLADLSSAAIDWGDGTTTQPVTLAQNGNNYTYDVSGGHTYGKPGPYTISVPLNDAKGSAATAVAKINVKQAANSVYGIDGGIGGGGSGPPFTIPDVDPEYVPAAAASGVAWTGPAPDLVSLGEALVEPNTGGVEVSTALDFDLSPGTGVSAHPALVYNSDTVSVRPILPVIYQSDPNGPLPSSISVILTWNGAAQATLTYSTAGHQPGDAYLLAPQVASAVAATGVYPYSVQVIGNGTSVNQTINGSLGVVVNDASPFGAGWWLDGLDRLVNVSGTAATGLLYVYGAGGSRFFAQNGTSYTSPVDDFGTLAGNGAGYLYTAKDQTKRYFDGGGRLTAVVDPHGLALTYLYDSQSNLTQVDAPDGGVTTLTYAGGLSSIQEPGGRLLNFTAAGGNLTGLTDVDASTRSFGYDAYHHLTNDQWSPLNATFSYDAGSGRLTGVNRGLGTIYTLAPRQTQGLWKGPTIPAASASADVAVLTDPLSKATTYTLTDVGRLLVQATPDGAVQSWGRNTAGLVTAYTDGDTHTTWRSYNGAEDMTLVSYPDGGSTAFQYDATFHKVTRTQNALNEVTTAAYNAQGDLTLAVDGVGAPTTYAYYPSAGADAGLVSTVADPLGHLSSYTYDTNRRELTFADPLNDVTTSGYDAAGNPRTVTDPMAHVTTTGYDARDRLTLAVAGDGGQTATAYDPSGDVTALTDPRGFVTTSAFDQRGWLVQTSEPQGRTTQYGYDVAGNATTVIDPNNHTSTYTFDAVGRQLTALVPLTSSLNALSSTAWDLAGNLTSATDPLGHTTTTLYDPMNRPVAVLDALGHAAVTVYNWVGRVVASADRDNHATLYAYDGDNRVTAVRDGAGAVRTTLYDLAGNVTKTVDGNGNVTTAVFDLANRQTRTVNALGQVSTLVYDKAGRATNAIDPLGHLTTLAYDNVGRKAAVIDPLGHTTTTLYDPAGNVTKTVDADGNTTQTAYDGLNRPTAVTDGLGNTTTRQYDPVGNVTSVTQPVTTGVTRTTTYTFDWGNRQTQAQDALSRYADNSYDNAGRLTAAIDFRGKETDYQYDPAGRRTLTTDPLHKVTTTLFDPAGNATQVIDPHGDPAYTAFDGDNRPFAVQDFNGKQALTYRDAAGNVVVSVDYRGQPTFTLYDPLNRATNVTAPLGQPSRTAFDPAGRPTLTTDPRGFRTTAVFDIAGRQTNLIDPAGRTSTLAYDAAGNLTQAIDQAGKITTFKYDALNRRTAVTDADSHTTTTGYDAAGRLTSSTDGLNHTTTFQYDLGDRQTAVLDGRGVPTTSVYDNADNLTQVIDGDGWTTTYQYASDNNKTAEIDPQGHTLTYAFDHQGKSVITLFRAGIGWGVKFLVAEDFRPRYDPSPALRPRAEERCRSNQASRTVPVSLLRRGRRPAPAFFEAAMNLRPTRRGLLGSLAAALLTPLRGPASRSAAATPPLTPPLPAEPTGTTTFIYDTSRPLVIDPGCITTFVYDPAPRRPLA